MIGKRAVLSGPGRKPLSGMTTFSSAHFQIRTRGRGRIVARMRRTSQVRAFMKVRGGGRPAVVTPCGEVSRLLVFAPWKEVEYGSVEFAD